MMLGCIPTTWAKTVGTAMMRWFLCSVWFWFIIDVRSLPHMLCCSMVLRINIFPISLSVAIYYIIWSVGIKHFNIVLWAWLLEQILIRIVEGLLVQVARLVLTRRPQRIVPNMLRNLYCRKSSCHIWGTLTVVSSLERISFWLLCIVNLYWSTIVGSSIRHIIFRLHLKKLVSFNI